MGKKNIGSVISLLIQDFICVGLAPYHNPSPPPTHAPTYTVDTQPGSATASYAGRRGASGIWCWLQKQRARRSKETHDDGSSLLLAAFILLAPPRHNPSTSRHYTPLDSALARLCLCTSSSSGIDGMESTCCSYLYVSATSHPQRARQACGCTRKPGLLSPFVDSTPTIDALLLCGGGFVLPVFWGGRVGRAGGGKEPP